MEAVDINKKTYEKTAAAAFIFQLSAILICSAPSRQRQACIDSKSDATFLLPHDVVDDFSI